jgi:hypothetical protein
MEAILNDEAVSQQWSIALRALIMIPRLPILINPPFTRDAFIAGRFSGTPLACFWLSSLRSRPR